MVIMNLIESPSASKPILPDLIDFRFDLEPPTWRTALLFLTSNNSVNIWSGFLHWGFIQSHKGEVKW